MQLLKYRDIGWFGLTALLAIALIVAVSAKTPKMPDIDIPEAAQPVIIKVPVYEPVRPEIVYKPATVESMQACKAAFSTRSHWNPTRITDCIDKSRIPIGQVIPEIPVVGPVEPTVLNGEVSD